ncbi:MAG TPA: ABC transporter substrate-binding protein [Ktedonobacteraceae bacterium]|jgi:polar amino acid transport system substrate-binding protein|nr:ABC transporter substrate-binding protein [Ktedonobacteraceae bacterium]
MLSYPSRALRKRAPLGALLMSVMVGLSLLVAACGSSGGGATTTGSGATPTAKPSIAAPTDLITPGVLTVGSDTTYPPQEFIDTATGKATGFDIDLITAMAQKMGLQAKIVTANFNTIIDDLTAKRYDVVISAITINDQRKQKVDFVPYFSAGESLLVPKGNPQHLTSVKDLCGKKVGVQEGTVEQDDLNAANKDCQSAGKPAINMTVLKDQTDVIQLLANGRVDATYQDSPVTDYYIKQNPGQFEVGGSIVNAAPEGIAVRKGDTSMFNAIQAAFNAVKSDGTYDQLFSKWQLNAAQKISLADVRQVA